MSAFTDAVRRFPVGSLVRVSPAALLQLGDAWATAGANDFPFVVVGVEKHQGDDDRPVNCVALPLKLAPQIAWLYADNVIRA